MIQTLNDKDIPPIHIMQLSGHKNLQSVNNDIHVSQEKQESMSRKSSGSTLIVQTETHSLVETAKQQSLTPAAAGPFKGAAFYGGIFTININSSSSSTEAHRQHTFEKIKRSIVFDSSDDDDSPPLR